MPIYEYVCTACDHRADILHGINDPGPSFCPSCGREGTMRKQFAPPAIHYRGSGWAKKDRSSSSSGSKASRAGTGEAARDGAGKASGDGARSGSGDGAGTGSGDGAGKGSGDGAPSPAANARSDAPASGTGD